MAYLAVMYTRAKYNDQAFLVEKFLARLLNEALKLQIVMHHRTANDYETMRGAVVECHASMVKAVQVGKGTPPFSLTGLTQQSDTASQETYTQWKRRSKMGNPKEGESTQWQLGSICFGSQMDQNKDHGFSCRVVI